MNKEGKIKKKELTYSTTKNITITRLIVGPLETNCYILQNSSRDALIVDPGDEGERIVTRIGELGANPRAIILTHGHCDHIAAVPEIVEKFSIPIFAHRDEHAILSSPDKNLCVTFGIELSLRAKEIPADLRELGFPLKVIHLPGHTPGSIGLLGDGFLISGDTIFAGGGVGRTDVPSGDSEKLAKSIKLLLNLDDELIVYPGHGGRFILGNEKKKLRQILPMLIDGLL